MSGDVPDLSWLDDAPPHSDADMPGERALNGSGKVSRGTPRHPPGQAPDVVDGGPPANISDTDIANGKRMAARFGDRIHYTPQQEWLLWDGKRWAPDDRSVGVQSLAKRVALGIYDEIPFASDQKAAFKHARDSQSRRSIEAMLFMARSEPGIPTRITLFDQDPWALNVNNGTVRLRTGQIDPHNKADRITKLVPITYDDAAICPLWERFMLQIAGGNSELVEYLQRVVGYCLTGLTSEQVLHFLYGLGANGKSVFSEVLADLLGEYSIIVSPEMVMTKRNSGIPNDIARLRGARLALMNETSQGSSFDEQKLKDLTGSDSLTGRFLRQEFFDFKPTHKLIIRGNHKPAIAGTDDGIWRRLRLVPFTIQFPAEAQDRDLLDKLKGELPGILNWAIAGCTAWHKRGLVAPEIVTEASKEYRSESDTLANFLAECCHVRNNSTVKSAAFFKAYSEFAKEQGEKHMPAKDLPHEMRRRGFQYERKNSGMMIEGVELKQGSTPDWRDQF
jgi:putative DNA primase/helicase